MLTYKNILGKGRTFITDTQDIYSLDVTLAKIICLLLEDFRATMGGGPADMTYTEWVGTIDQMIQSFTVIAEGGMWSIDNPVEIEQVQVGLDLFSKYFTHLWM